MGRGITGGFLQSDGRCGYPRSMAQWHARLSTTCETPLNAVELLQQGREARLTESREHSKGSAAQRFGAHEVAFSFLRYRYRTLRVEHELSLGVQKAKGQNMYSLSCYCPLLSRLSMWQDPTSVGRNSHMIKMQALHCECRNES
jgi:hypothetical protein